ncbi:hypothetical protein WA171_006481 [Blastocystis sp. BT1]
MLSLSHCFQKGLGTLVRGFAAANDVVFKQNMLNTVLEEENWKYYVSLVSATSESLLYGYLQTIKKDDQLLVISNGFDGDRIAKKAHSMGIYTLWMYHSMLYPIDVDEAAQDILYHHEATHALFVHTESFTGSITPLRQIMKKVRKVRSDISVCVDNRNGFLLHPMPTTDDIIDYSIHDTHILGVQPSFSFMIAHKPAIMAEADVNPSGFLSSIYNSHMNLETMTKVQGKYNEAMKDGSWRNIVYQYEETKARIVNKVKLLLPPIPQGMDQSCVSASFLVPQEAARLRELLESLEEYGIPVEHKFITSGLPAISFNTEAIIDYVEKGGDILDIYKGIERVLLRHTPGFFQDGNLLKEEEKYRRKYVYGENIEIASNKTIT